MRKITISISDELDTAIIALARVASCSKSRLIENYMRESAWVKEKIGEIRSEDVVECAMCRTVLGLDLIRIQTPAHGLICHYCWSSGMGKIIEEHGAIGLDVEE